MSEGAIIVRPNTAVSVADLSRLDAAADAFAEAAMSVSTRRAYTSDWQGFAAWCGDHGLAHAPAEPDTVRLYVSHLAEIGRATSTIDRKVAAIASAHRFAGHENPCAMGRVRATLSGIRRKVGRPPDKKRALTVDLLVQVIRKIRGQDRTAVRDRALILLCFGAALRRSELVALEVGDLTFKRRGLIVTLRRSKTDQEGEGRKVGVLDGKLKIPGAVKAWIELAGITDGYLFPGANRGQAEIGHMSEARFAEILKARCKAAGYDPRDFSGHSPRRGWATSAGEDGVDLRRTADHMRHVKLETTRGYMEEGDLLANNPGKGFT